MDVITEQQILTAVRDSMDHVLGVPPGSKILIGLSGGADSVALTDILHRLGYRLTAAHCNFRLRGEESVRDHRFAAGFAASLSLPFRDVVFDTPDYAADKKISIEMACRELRYEWFEKERLACEAEYIAVAHHRDDSVETLLLNLVRGTGIAGLTGIRPANGKVIRPLLQLSRPDIENYLAVRKLEYVTDSTNRQDIYMRNKIRLQVLPLLQTLNPSVATALERTSSHLAETEKVYRCAIAAQLEEVTASCDGVCRVDIAKLMRMPSPTALLFEILSPLAFTPAVIEEVEKSLLSGSGKIFYSPEYRLIKDRSELMITPLPQKEEPLVIPKEITEIKEPLQMVFRYIPNRAGYAVPRQKNIASFDASRLHFPLILRHWKEGDRFVPFGMKGSRKVSDYFSDRKYSIYEKEKAWLLCSGDDIIWIVGERTAENFKITDSTQLILQIECEIKLK